MQVLVKIAVGAFIGWIAGTVTEDVLEAVGVPKHAATVAGGIVGAIV